MKDQGSQKFNVPIVEEVKQYKYCGFKWDLLGISLQFPSLRVIQVLRGIK